ncbi:MAG: cold shock domain-containing protein [Bacteroidales bacterium]
MKQKVLILNVVQFITNKLFVMETGTVKFFNEKKGYGFIVDEKTEKDVFVHHTGLLEPIANDDRVSFEISEDERGKKAINVKKAE